MTGAKHKGSAKSTVSLDKAVGDASLDDGENIRPRSGHDQQRRHNELVGERKVMHDISNARVKWGVNGGVDTGLLEDMGVAYLDDGGLAELTPPKVPKLSASGASRRGTATRVASDGFVLFKRSEVSGGRDRFADLSDESILEIFKWLPKSILVRCALVCRRWMRLAFDESLWRRLDLGKKHLGPGVLGRVLGRGTVVLKLAMAEIRGPPFDGPAPSLVGEGTSKLQYLDLSMATVDTETLREILSACTRLRKLSLEHCTVDDAACSPIAGNVHLECLNLSMCEGLTAEGVRILSRGCQRLQSWNLAWTHLSSEALWGLVREVSPRLQHLNLAGCGNALSDSQVRALVRRCPNLTDLDLSDATGLGAPAIEAVAADLPRLEHLHVSRCYNVPPATYLLLSEKASLRNLELFGVLTEPALATLRRGLPDVEINKHVFSTVARPTTGLRRTSIWGLRVRD